jgi:hypothetical protein
VRQVTDSARYKGKDENGEPIFDPTVKLPQIPVTFTTKCHGTNASRSINVDGEQWSGSRTQIITPESDNAGFATFCHSKNDVFAELFKLIPFNGYDYITIFGEWCGTKIQKGVAISELPRMFVIFDIKRSYDNPEDGDNVYATNEEIKLLRSPENQIYNIFDYPTHEIVVDFGNPSLSQNAIIDLTLSVEEECPVGKAFGVSGVGEGVVGSFIWNGIKHRFKSKGIKHAGVSKVKVLHTVDEPRLRKILEIADQVTPSWRLSQMYKTIQGESDEILERTKIAEFIKLVIADVVKEDLDIIIDAGFELKDVASKISNISKNYFFDMEKQDGL